MNEYYELEWDDEVRKIVDACGSMKHCSSDWSLDERGWCPAADMYENQAAISTMMADNQRLRKVCQSLSEAIRSHQEFYPNGHFVHALMQGYLEVLAEALTSV